MIDETEIYHFGASMKDLVKKWFAFSRLDVSFVTVLDRLGEIGVLNDNSIRHQKSCGSSYSIFSTSR